MRSVYTHKDQLFALFGLFIVWKGLILLIVFSSPGVGYDTSASITVNTGNELILDETPRHFPSQWLKFVRWDAIYYTHMAEQGLIFEQEWAFGIGLSSSLSFLAKRKAILIAPKYLHAGTYILRQVSYFLSGGMNQYLRSLQAYFYRIPLIGSRLCSYGSSRDGLSM